MKRKFRATTIALAVIAWGVGAGASVLSVRALADSQPASVQAAAAAPASAIAPAMKPNSKVQLDRTGRTRTGIASYYAKRYGGRKMADGTPFQLNGDNAASLTLPLGTTARVTNLETGRSAVVVIRDRGPYVDGRIVDLSPGTARSIGIDKKGLAKVEVTPLAVPMGDGTFNVIAANNTTGATATGAARGSLN